MFTAKFRNGARNQPNTPMVLTIDALLMKFGTRCINTQTPKSILQMNASNDLLEVDEVHFADVFAADFQQ